MAKAIILVRVSTVRQEIDAQRRELEQLATADGWKSDDLIVIEGVGASAIKLNEIYMNEMEELYNTIEGNDIGAVYAWEISRIGRNEEILMRFKNFMIEHNVQLIVKNPSLRLLNDDGSVNKGVELAFSLFATMSKQEMEIKQERFKRAKARNKAEGKFTGGRIKLGYTLDKNKYFILDEEKAQAVRQVFEWFVNDGVSQKKIYHRLCDMGIYKGKNLFRTDGRCVGDLLRDKSYIGENNYPQIVSRELFHKANEIISNRHKPHESKNVYLCKSLIKDTMTGGTLVVKASILTYQLNHVNHKISLNINAMDYIALFAADVLRSNVLSAQAEKNANEYEAKVAGNNYLIAAKQAQIKEYEKAIERAIDMNIKQPKYFPTERMERVIKQNDALISKLKEAIADIQTENTRMENAMSGTQQFINTLYGLSDEKKKEMIDSLIDRIEVTRLEQHKYQIVIKSKIGQMVGHHFEYELIGRKVHVCLVYPDRTKLDVTDRMKAHKRFTRKRYNGK